MSVTRKPRAKAPDVEAIISKGGSVAKRDTKSEKGTTPVVLRIPIAMLQEVDQTLEARPIKKPRHTWLLEAVQEKLERESR